MLEIKESYIEAAAWWLKRARSETSSFDYAHVIKKLFTSLAESLVRWKERKSKEIHEHVESIQRLHDRKSIMAQVSDDLATLLFTARWDADMMTGGEKNIGAVAFDLALLVIDKYSAMKQAHGNEEPPMMEDRAPKAEVIDLHGGEDE